jgi:hypothetical protein
MNGAQRTRSVQAPAAIVMIRPHHFTPNTETACDNAFQADARGLDPVAVARQARDEVTQAADTLEAAGVRSHLFDDTTAGTPDSVFPNNWISTHTGGHVALYPMFAANRRRERRSDVVDMLKAQYRVQDVVDYSGLEQDGLFLEGTGAMVLDHIDRVAYVSRSNRADPITLERFCAQFHYEPMVFDALDGTGTPIYHTNVLMCIATDFVLIGLDMLVDPQRRAHIVQRFEESGRTVIALRPDQIADFAGNAIELQGRGGRVLVLSSRAAAALDPDQRRQVEESARLLPLDVPTIELAGGSVRCMVAGIHLARR